MVSNKEIKESLNYKKKGLDPKAESKKNRILEKSKKFSNKRICQSCGYKNPHTAEFCIECGEKIPKFTLPFADTFSENNEENEDKVSLPFANVAVEPAAQPNTVKTPQNKNRSTGVKARKKIVKPLDQDINVTDSVKDFTIASPLDEIKKAKELLENGSITKEEFEIIKTKCIERI